MAGPNMETNFVGTYLTENGSTAVVVSRSAMVINGKKQVIWVGFVIQGGYQTFNVWDIEGRALDRIRNSGTGWDLKEAIKEKAY